MKWSAFAQSLPFLCKLAVPPNGVHKDSVLARHFSDAPNLELGDVLDAAEYFLFCFWGFDREDSRTCSEAWGPCRFGWGTWDTLTGFHWLWRCSLSGLLASAMLVKQRVNVSLLDHQIPCYSWILDVVPVVWWCHGQVDFLSGSVPIGWG